MTLILVVHYVISAIKPGASTRISIMKKILCHDCRVEAGTSVAKPLCYECWQK